MVAFPIFWLGFVIWMFAPAFLRVHSFTEFLELLPVPAFFVTGGLVVLRGFVIQGFGLEEVVADGERLVSTRKALFLSRRIEVPYREITSITAETLLGMGGVKVAASKRTFTIGTNLWSDDAKEIAQKLRHRVNL